MRPHTEVESQESRDGPNLESKGQHTFHKSGLKMLFEFSNQQSQLHYLRFFVDFIDLFKGN